MRLKLCWLTDQFAGVGKEILACKVKRVLLGLSCYSSARPTIWTPPDLVRRISKLRPPWMNRRGKSASFRTGSSFSPERLFRNR